jgi:hypothetical protein
MEDTSASTRQNIPLPPDCQEKIDDQKRFFVVEEQIKFDLRTNPRYQEFFQQYSAKSVERFIDHYAKQKVRCLFLGEYYREEYRHLTKQFLDEAKERLWEIQQKKLFNLQCQWRAEQVTVPEIELCSDFDLLERRIQRCSFLPPITEQEVEFYKEYFASSECSYDDEVWDWQEYDDWKNEMQDDSEGPTYPEWYNFYDVRFGTQGLLNLPDTRQPKEEFYYNLALEHEQQQRKQQPLPQLALPRDPRERLEVYGSTRLEEFVRQFESPQVLKYFLATRRNINEDSEYSKEDFDNALQTLFEMKARVPMAASHSWRAAFFQTFTKYRKEQVLAAFDEAYKEYQQEIARNIQPFSYFDSDSSPYAVSAREDEKHYILRGRVLNGEPENLDF